MVVVSQPEADVSDKPWTVSPLPACGKSSGGVRSLLHKPEVWWFVGCTSETNKEMCNTHA